MATRVTVTHLGYVWYNGTSCGVLRQIEIEVRLLSRNVSCQSAVGVVRGTGIQKNVLGRTVAEASLSVFEASVVTIAGV